MGEYSTISDRLREEAIQHEKRHECQNCKNNLFHSYVHKYTGWFGTTKEKPGANARGRES